MVCVHNPNNLMSLHRTNVWVCNDTTTLKVTLYIHVMCTDLGKVQLFLLWIEKKDQQKDRWTDRYTYRDKHCTWLVSVRLQVSTIKLDAGKCSINEEMFSWKSIVLDLPWSNQHKTGHPAKKCQFLSLVQVLKYITLEEGCQLPSVYQTQIVNNSFCRMFTICMLNHQDFWTSDFSHYMIN